uniref:ADOR65 n=1 Tax=Adoxophyes orana granulovirus TaxID=170617 RepID=A0A0A7V4X6_GVAO|nr:ADOR65 [Adoxophyes orana granulovirus]
MMLRSNEDANVDICFLCGKSVTFNYDYDKNLIRFVPCTVTRSNRCRINFCKDCVL